VNGYAFRNAALLAMSATTLGKSKLLRDSSLGSTFALTAAVND
jgi:hypothetical protein